MSYTDKIANIAFHEVRFNTTWTVDIYDRDAYAGAVYALILTNDPVVIRYPGKGDLLAGRRGSECVLSVVASPTDDYSWLKTADAKKYRVEILKGAALHWIGYIIPGSTIEEYLPYRVLTVIANDQLGMLQQSPYKSLVSGFAPEGYVRTLDAFRLAITGTESTLAVRSGVNLYEDSMDVGDDDDPLYQSEIQQNKFIDPELKPSSCDTVLDALLGTWDARMFQSGGYWYIIRTVEYAVNTVEIREYNQSTGALVQHVHLATQKTVNKTTFIALRGTQTEAMLGWKEYRLVENYGLKPSAILGYNFPDLEFVAGVPRHFTISATSGWAKETANDINLMYCPLADYVAGQYFETDEIAVVSTGANPVMLQIFGGAITWAPQSRWKIYCTVNDGGTTYYWNGSAWGTTPKYLYIAMHAGTFDEPKKHETIMDAFPVSGQFKIRIFDQDADPFITSIVIMPAADPDYSLASGLERNIVIDSANVTIPAGDSMIFTNTFPASAWASTFYDGWIKVASGDLAEYWKARGSAGSSFLISDWKLQSRIDQYATPSSQLRATILGEYEFYQSVVFNSKVYVPDEIEIHLRSATVNGTWIEVKTPATGVSYTETSDKVSVPGSIGKGLETNGFIVDVIPQQTGGQKIYISGGTVLKSGGGLNGGGTVFDDYRAQKGVALTSGTNTVTFTSPHPGGTSYTLDVFCVSAQGYEVGKTVTNQTADGFDITVDEDCTLQYKAFKEL